jgi:hypothetical protein
MCWDKRIEKAGPLLTMPSCVPNTHKLDRCQNKFRSGHIRHDFKNDNFLNLWHPTLGWFKIIKGKMFNRGLNKVLSKWFLPHTSGQLFILDFWRRNDDLGNRSTRRYKEVGGWRRLVEFGGIIEATGYKGCSICLINSSISFFRHTF